ncbi:MAG: RagB/SusD family nutrient uptake outer membrane protein [Prevotella sp.]|nr:RagB/SusD family nutrient uptake outer membrane protein [Prevotella sp.]
MKIKSLYIAIATLGAMGLTACDDYLDVESPSQMDQNMVYSSAEFATNAINGVYVLFGEDPYTSRMCGVWMQNTDVEAMSVQEAVATNHRQAVWPLQGPGNVGWSDVKKVWDNNLQAIERANQVRAGIDASTIANTDEMQQIKGEATCLKAYRYYLMCNFFGDVPYYDVAAKWGEEIDKPRTDKNIVYSRVLQQLVDIEPNMKWSDVNTGGIERMNRDFAIGLIARIALFRAGYGMTKDGTMKRADEYLDVAGNPDLAVTYKDVTGAEKTARTYTEYYQMAKDYCQKLIQLKPRELYANFEQSFINEMNYTIENNAEVLYEVAFVQNYGGDIGWSFGVPNTGTNVNGTTTAQVAMTPTFYMSFADNDVRRDIDVAKYAHENDTVKAAASTGLHAGKWDRARAAHDLGSGSSKGTGINYPLMRYSDVLLMLAEAENELNGPTVLAKEQLLKVRARAFANSPTFGTDVNDYVAKLNTKESFFNAIVDERAWEFGGEAIRKFDLIRWNLYAKKIEEAMRTALCWGIATNEDLISDPAVLARFPEAVNYTTWADRLYYVKSGKENLKSDIKWYNEKYKADLDDATMTAEGWQKVNWGSNMIKRTRTYVYNGKDYGTTTPTKANNADGSVTYTLGAAPNTATVTVQAGEPTGIIRKDVYAASDYYTRLYRGYSNGALTGNGIVPYLLPITTETLSASSVLDNDGYHILDANMEKGTNVEVATIEKEYK